nr:RNA-directed DNA polymerase, eukaryota, reverse transcriptase zinc-binding domain protein [Tanacetum cinerariifolium]
MSIATSALAEAYVMRKHHQEKMKKTTIMTKDSILEEDDDRASSTIDGSVNLSHMFYADDAVFVGQWSKNNISTLVHVLECFHRVSGLKINMSKSKILGVHVDNVKVSRAANKLGCLVLKTLFLYLGSFVGGAMHRLQAWNDIVDRVRMRLSKWKMKMLSIGGRLTLVNCHFFNGHDVSSKKTSWVQWNKVLAPKDKGGLGVSSLYALNRGLMFKWVWRFLTQDISLWARVIKAIHGGDCNIGAGTRSGTKSCWLNIVNEINVLSKKDINLMNFLRIKLGSRESTLFWEDVWSEGGKLEDRFPRAYALESCKTITVGSKLVQPNLTFSFRRIPRAGAEQTQTDELAALMQPVTLAPISDRWTWTLNSSGEFSVASVRNLIDVNIFPEGEHKTKWIRYVPIKVNTHAWNVMSNSLPTRFNILRRGIDIDSITCVNCDTGVETTSHLFFTCDMAQQVTRLITRWWDVPDLEIDSYGSWKFWMVNLRMSSKNKKMLEGVFYVMWWLLWAFRNKKIFEDKAPSKAILWIKVIKSIHGNSGALDNSYSSRLKNSTWIEILKAINKLKVKGVDLMGFCKIVIGNGSITRFWHDIWYGDICFKEKFKRLSFNLELQKDANVASKLQASNVASSFRRPPRSGNRESASWDWCTWPHGVLEE